MNIFLSILKNALYKYIYYKWYWAWCLLNSVLNTLKLREVDILFINVVVDLQLKPFRLKAFLKSFRYQMNYTFTIQIGRYNLLFGECLGCSSE